MAAPLAGLLRGLVGPDGVAAVDVSSPDTLVALLFVEPGLPACDRALAALDHLAAVATRPSLLPVAVPLSGDDAALAATLEGTPHLLAVPPRDAAVPALRRWCGLGVAATPPELVLVSTRAPGAGATTDDTAATPASPRVVATDAVEALLRGELTAEALAGGQPDRARSNVFVARCWEAELRAGAGVGASAGGGSTAASTSALAGAPAAGAPHLPPPPAYGARLHPDSLLAARLYPGDPVTLRRLPHLHEAVAEASSPAPAAAAAASSAATGSLCVYANPPVDEGGDSSDSDSDEDATGSAGSPPAPSPARHEIWLPAGVLLNLGAAPGDSVALAPTADAPEARSVTLKPLAPAVEAVAAAELARLLLGAAAPLASGVAHAADAAAADGIEARTRAYALADTGLLRPFFGLPLPAEVTSRLSSLVAAVGAVRTGALSYDELDDARPERARQMLAAAVEAAGGGGGSAALGAPAKAANGAISLSQSSSSFVSPAEASSLAAMVTESQCRHVPLVQGQTLALPDTAAAGGGGGVHRFFTVAATAPRYTAVTVGPRTALVYEVA
jgi:hypothetical protein